jgi:long-subunit acyl-CoA synthetase (AMP-forming)
LKYASLIYFAALDMPLFNMWGMSEATGAFTVQTHGKFDLSTAGYAMPGQDLKIDKPD